MTQPNNPHREPEDDEPTVEPVVEPEGRTGSIICDDVPPVEQTLRNIMRRQRRIG